MEITKGMHIYETFKNHLLNTLKEGEDFYFIELIRRHIKEKKGDQTKFSNVKTLGGIHINIQEKTKMKEVVLIGDDQKDKERKKEREK